jgi:hypothetical protein
MIASGPKMFTCKILFATSILPGYMNGTFPFDETNYRETAYLSGIDINMCA